ncbi:hypothetical protein JXD38_07575 [candidate division WOR-3 bacterium]|nr:hypothetical protein [candidate division WOR-3 bacterium]
MDWLHKVRHEAEAKRIRDGLTVEQWLEQLRVRAAESKERRRSHEDPTVARDTPGSGKP